MAAGRTRDRLRAAYNETPFASWGKGGFDLASYTEHYGLHQWESSDDFLRTDFNADHALIDEALAGLETAKSEIVTGTYTGNGAGSQFVSLGFTPKAVLVISERGTTTSYGGLALPGQVVYEPGLQKVMEISGTGFTVYGAGSSSAKGNDSDMDYFFLAIK